MAKGERQPHKQWDSAGKRVPVRSCVVCRRRYPQGELVRFTKTDAGVTLETTRRRAQARGGYICSSPQCRTEKALLRISRTDAARLAAELEVYFSGLNTHKGTYEQISPTQHSAGAHTAPGGQ